MVVIKAKQNLINFQIFRQGKRAAISVMIKDIYNLTLHAAWDEGKLCLTPPAGILFCFFRMLCGISMKFYSRAPY